jgi:hypothetical protein
MSPEKRSGPQQFTIHIDRGEYHADHSPLTGAELRQIPSPPVGEDFDLYLTVAGPGNDELIADDRAVDLKNGMRFFTAPRVITPG